MVFRESRVVDDVWAGVAPRALAGEALLIVLDNFEYDVVVASQGSLERRRRTQKYARRDHRHNSEINAALGDTNLRSRQLGVSRLSS